MIDGTTIIDGRRRATGFSVTPRQPDAAALTLLKPNRLAGLDFAKGTLVLMMVLYHWLNYFVGPDSEAYRYLRFLTPSFIFVTGFLVAKVYVRRFSAGETHIPSRLIRRGVKLLALVFVLNALAGLAAKRVVAQPGSEEALAEFAWAFFTGSVPVGFSVLVPISYLLLLSAILLVISTHIPGVFHAVSLVTFGMAVIGEWTGFQNGYVELLSIGMLGASAGHLSIDRVNRLVHQTRWLTLAYVVYLGAIAAWNVVYVLQVLGVSVNVALLYRLGYNTAGQHTIASQVLLLGQYSLFAYIAQIVILRMVRSEVWWSLSSGNWLYAALFIAAGGTLLSVQAVDRLRRRVPGINRLYSAVFA